MLSPKETYKDIVIRHIYDGLMEGRYSPGEKVLESVLATDLGLSRAPVREGLRELVSIGLLEYRPQVGNFVATMTPQEIVDTYVTRGVLEGFASSEAAAEMSEEEFDLLDEKAGRMQLAASRNRKKELNDLGEIFHKSLFRHCRNLQLHKQAESLSLKHHLLFHRYWANLYSPEEIASRHRKIVDVMRSKNPDQIEKTIREHYFITGNRIADLARQESGNNA